MYNMAFGADKPFGMAFAICKAHANPSLIAQAGPAAQKVVMHKESIVKK